MTIRNWSKVMVSAAATLVFAALGLADTLELKDGRVLQGRYLGGTQAVLRFEVNGDVQTFPTNDIVALTFTRGSGGPPPAQPSVDRIPQPSREEAPPPDAPSVAPSDQPPSNGGGDVTLPINQPLLVRMIDSVDSSKNQVGDIFKASLETDLYINGLLVARKGTDVYGKLATADKSGTFSGKFYKRGSQEKYLSSDRIFLVFQPASLNRICSRLPPHVLGWLRTIA